MKSAIIAVLICAMAVIFFWLHQDLEQLEAKCAQYVDHELADVPRATDAEYAMWKYRSETMLTTCERAGGPPQ